MEVGMGLWTKVTLATAVVGAAAITIWIASSAPEPVAPTADRATQSSPAKKNAVRTTRTASPVTRDTAKTEDAAPAWPNASTVIVPSYLVTQPKLADRVQPLLQRGADVQLAAEGFRTPELFAAVAHAAHNLEVPFVVLKHRVLNEGMTLSKAIAVTRPDVNAKEEASEAMEAARADVFEAGRIGS
jgi:hypothetical protein